MKEKEDTIKMADQALDEREGLPSHGIILEEICQEENIKIRWLSNNWVAFLEKDGEKRYVSGYKFGLDSHAVGEILDDKFALYEVLKAQNLPVIPHSLLYAETTRAKFARNFRSREYVLETIEEYGLPIVIKPNGGTGGQGVYRIESIDKLDENLEKVFRHCFSASLCPFYRLKTEYRVVLLEDEPRLVYAKRPQPKLDTENGVGMDEEVEVFSETAIDGESQADWKFNLKQGAIAEKVTDKQLETKLIELARRAARAVNLKFGSVDIAERETGELVIMEINSGVMIKCYLGQHPEDYAKVKAIYRDAVRVMFREFGGRGEI